MPEVKITPKGTTFEAQEYESILQAGLKAGVALGYGCSNGNCGDCVAKLVSGEIGKIRHYDFHIPDGDKEMGCFPMCCYQAESDIVIEAEEATGAADIPLQAMTVKVKDIEEINDQIIRLHLRTPRSNRLRFMAGQSVTLGGEEIPDGTYSVASCPCDDMNLYFHIPDIPGDGFSERLFAGDLKKNDNLDLSGPMGHFVLGDDIERPLLLISWHTGFASMEALIEHYIALDPEFDLHLYRLSPVPDVQYLDNLCRSWTDAFDNFHYHPLSDRYTLVSDESEGERILSKIINNHDEIQDMDVYVAGPPSLISAAEKVFLARGLPVGRLKCETIALGFYDE